MTKVAIIEDDIAIVQMYRMKFTGLDYKVVTAGNGEDGLVLIEKERPDIILLDLMMPIMNGDTMLRKLRETEWGKEIKVIVLTNMGENEMPTVIGDSNVVDYIVKADMTPKQVAEKVRTALSEQSVVIMELLFLYKKHLVGDIWEFYFQKPAGFSFDAGDYIEMSIKDVGSHWVSMSSSPHETDIRYTVKISADNPSKFKMAIQQLSESDTVLSSPAIGNFNIPRNPEPVLLIAAGIGITPYRSMLLDLVQSNRKNQLQQTTLVYGAKKNQLIYKSELEQINFKLIAQEKRITYEDIALAVDDISEQHIYLAGPEEFCVDLYKQLFELGHPKHKLRLSYFPGYPGPWNE